MSTALDILLRNEIPKPQNSEYKIKRLSDAFGEDVVFTIKELTFNRVSEIRNMSKDGIENDVHILLAGVVAPNLKDQALQDKYSAATPAELVKKLLNPGEVQDIASAIERLSGFRQMTIQEIKKKSEMTTNGA